MFGREQHPILVRIESRRHVLSLLKSWQSSKVGMPGNQRNNKKSTHLSIRSLMHVCPQMSGLLEPKQKVIIKQNSESIIHIHNFDVPLKRRERKRERRSEVLCCLAFMTRQLSPAAVLLLGDGMG